MSQEIKPAVHKEEVFDKLEIRVGRVIEVEMEPSAPKLSYKMLIDFGKFGRRVSVGRFTRHPVDAAFKADHERGWGDMFQKLSGGSGNVLGFKIGDHITAEDVLTMSSIMAEAIAASGKLRLLIEIEGFRHMDVEALLEKLKFARDHSRDIEKIALVSDRTWIKAWFKVGGLFTHAEGEHFNRSDMEAAWDWVRS